MAGIGKILLLCIGINKYDFLPNNHLKYSIKDANLIFEGYSKYNCEYKGILTDTNATKMNILKSIEKISSKARDNDYLILSFAGHGVAKNNGEKPIDSKTCFICPYDFDPEHIETTGISLNDLNTKIKQIKSKSKLLLLDACHSGGALRRDLHKFNFRDIKAQELLDIGLSGEGNGIITACDSHETALENDELKQGIFTHAFCQILSSDQKDQVDFKDTYNKIYEKVKKLTSDKQHPKSRCDDENFEIPIIPKTIPPSKNIQLDLSLVPTQKNTKLNNFGKFEDKIIHLIQTNRNIELDKILKKSINQAYKEIGKLISLPHKGQKEEVIAIYESCRNNIKPIILILDHILEYGNESIVLNNLDLIFRFEELSHMINGGLTAIIQIPSTLIAEIIFKLLGKAHKKRNSKIIRKFFTLSSSYFSGKGIPFIYDRKTWHPEIFHGSVKNFFEYIYPHDRDQNDIIQKQEIRDLSEIIFLIDSYSSTNNEYTSFPIYFYFDNKIRKSILNNFSDKKFLEYVNETFNIQKNDFIDAIIKRQTEISTWSDFQSHFWRSQDDYDEFIKLKD